MHLQTYLCWSAIAGFILHLKSRCTIAGDFLHNASAFHGSMTSTYPPPTFLDIFTGYTEERLKDLILWILLYFTLDSNIFHTTARIDRKKNGSWKNRLTLLFPLLNTNFCWQFERLITLGFTYCVGVSSTCSSSTQHHTSFLHSKCMVHTDHILQ